MSSYGYIAEKSADEPDPAYMRHCRRTELRDDKSSSDGLNGSIRLSEDDLNAVGAAPGDRVKVYIESGDRYVHYERSTYSDRPGIGLPKKQREQLGLDKNNREVEVWIDEPDESEPDEGSSDDSRKQVSLTGEEPEEPPYVFIPDDSPFRYHHVKPGDADETECGISFDNQEHRRFKDPSDALDECSDCFIRSSEDMTNEQLIRWFGDQAGFDHDHGTPTYMSQKQMKALRDYVIELQEQAESANDEDAEASLSHTSALHS
jgi:hypothetical protein